MHQTSTQFSSTEPEASSHRTQSPLDSTPSLRGCAIPVNTTNDDVSTSADHHRANPFCSVRSSSTEGVERAPPTPLLCNPNSACDAHADGKDVPILGTTIPSKLTLPRTILNKTNSLLPDVSSTPADPPHVNDKMLDAAICVRSVTDNAMAAHSSLRLATDDGGYDDWSRRIANRQIRCVSTRLSPDWLPRCFWLIKMISIRLQNTIANVESSLAPVRPPDGQVWTFINSDCKSGAELQHIKQESHGLHQSKRLVTLAPSDIVLYRYASMIWTN